MEKSRNFITSANSAYFCANSCIFTLLLYIIITFITGKYHIYIPAPQLCRSLNTLSIYTRTIFAYLLRSFSLKYMIFTAEHIHIHIGAYVFLSVEL